MAFVPKNLGEWKLRVFPKKASTTLTAGMAVIQDTSDSGRITVATTSSDLIAGILQATYASTDATNVDAPYLVPIQPQATVVVTSASAATPGTTMDIASGALSVDPGASTEDVFTCTKQLTSTSCEGFFNIPAPTRA